MTKVPIDIKLGDKKKNQHLDRWKINQSTLISIGDKKNNQHQA